MIAHVRMRALLPWPVRLGEKRGFAMTKQLQMKIFAGIWVLASVLNSSATVYYVNDSSREYDVYCKATGNSANDGLTPATPKASLADVVSIWDKDDVVYIDTGEYKQSVQIKSTGGGRVTLVGSTNGTCLVGKFHLDGASVSVDISNLVFYAESDSAFVNYHALMTLSNVRIISTNGYALEHFNARAGSSFKNCVLYGRQAIWDRYALANNAFAFTNCTIVSKKSDVGQAAMNTIYDHCMLVSLEGSVFSSVPASNVSGRYNLFYGLQGIGASTRGFEEFKSIFTNFTDSVWGNPGFVDVDNLDFHLSSPAGHFVEYSKGYGVVTGRAWIVDSSLGYSPAIDAGDLMTGEEPNPNGGRRNLGAYGGTKWASKSRPANQKWLQVQSCNDGGVVVGQTELCWNSGNFTASDKVQVQISTNAGTKWITLATVPATNKVYTWTIQDAHSSPQCMWRVRTSDNSVVSESGRIISARSSLTKSFTFYVNDSSRTGDQFCTKEGDDSQNGLTPATPKRTIQAILDTYALYAGDQILVDTGLYDEEAPVTIGAWDRGVQGNPVVLRGTGKGTVLNRGNASWDVIRLENTANWKIQDLEVKGGRYGFYSTLSENIDIENVEIDSNNLGISIENNATSNLNFSHVSIHDNSLGVNANSVNAQDIVLANCVIWNNATALRGLPTSLRVENSIIGGDATCRLFDSTTYPAGDYNVLHVSSYNGTVASLTDLQAVQSDWQHCLVADPLFVDSGNANFHLRSVTGHCEVSGGKTNWVKDTFHSPAIDFASPSASFANEPKPNGGRANVGLYANTAQASKSRTNAWIQMMSYNEGGTLNAQSGAQIQWTAGNLGTGATLTLQLSRDGGTTWETLASKIPAANETYYYQKTTVENQSSLNALLRLRLESDTSVFSQTAQALTYRDGAFSFYVNDASTVGDVYCTAAGAAGDGRGVSPGEPLDSLQNILANYDLAQGDVVYIDTGTYTDSHTITFKKFGINTNSATPFVRVLGSTNYPAGGTVIGDSHARRSLGMEIPVLVSNLVVENLTFTNFQTAVSLSNVVKISFSGLNIRGASGVGISVGNAAESVTIEHSAFAGNGIGIGFRGNSTGTRLNHCVFWNNTTGVYATAQADVAISNSILGARAFGSVLYAVATNHALIANHNGVFAGGNAAFARYVDGSWTGDNLYAWQQKSGQDVDSIPGNPMMADPDNYDYHLMTERTLGRYLDNGSRTTDEASSPLLCAGSNGENIGRWGGTSVASLPQDGKYLVAWSFRDAGEVKSGTVPLRWGASKDMSNDTVRVDYSVDGGKHWKTVARKLAAKSGLTSWNTKGIADTPAAMWRVVSESDETCTSDNGVFLAIRNKPLKLYVASSAVDTNSAAYVTVPGKADNWEAKTNAPLSSLKLALERYDLEAGDTIYVERGVYTESEAIEMGYKQSGAPKQPVTIMGLTNRPYDSVVLELDARRGGSQVLSLEGVKNVLLDSIMFSNAWSGVTATQSTGIELMRTRFGYFVTNALSAGIGAEVKLSHSVLEDVKAYGIVAGTGSVVNVDHAFIQDTVANNIRVYGGNLSVSNSILEASGQGNVIYFMDSASSKFSSDYNSIRAQNSAVLARYPNGTSDRFLFDWQTSREGANDMRSSGYAPQMADVSHCDYHLLSTAGRYDADSRKWVKDDQSSILIDLGTGDYSLEPANNGGRANIGPYGNTAEASKSTGTAKIIPLTMSDGGTMSGTVKLYWGWNGLSDTTRVNVLFSGDGGATWTNKIASNIYLNQGAEGVSWNTTNTTSTAMGMWRVETTDGKVVGQTETLFAVRNAALTYYVNDGNTNGDVYCTSVGSASNDGLSPATPMDSLERLFGRYGLAAGDTVYVDTGTYIRQEPLTLVPRIAATTNLLVIQGSTNYIAGGTVFSNSVSSNAVLVLSGAESIEIRDLTLAGGRSGLSLQQSSYNRFYRVLSDRARGNAFELDVHSGDNAFEECAAVEFSEDGLYVAPIRNSQAEFPHTNMWLGGVMISYGMNSTNPLLPINTSTFVEVTSGKFYITNSAFQANGSRDVVFKATEGSIVADYNAYEMSHPGTKLAEWAKEGTVPFGLQSRAYGNLAAWRADSGQDRHSFVGALSLADVEKRDFHPMSPAGRYDPALGRMVKTDDVLSPLVQTGLGGRNIGWYRDGKEASLPTTSLSCALSSYSDAGLAEGVVALDWKVQGGGGNESVTIFVSTNSGVSWSQSGTAKASAGTFAWDSTSVPSCGSARWQLRSSGSVLASSARDFVVHNESLSYYVNDGQRTGDKWCRAIGSDSNTGYTPDKPKATLASLLEDCTLGAGDVVYVDCGTYAPFTAVSIDYRDHGTIGQPLVIQGAPHANTVFTNNGLSINNTKGIAIRDFVIRPATTGVSMDHAEDMALDGVDVLNARWSGMSLSVCSNVSARHSLFANALTNGIFCEASYGVFVENNTIVGNGEGAICANAQLLGPANTNRNEAFISVSNSILSASGLRVPIYKGTARFFGNYNNLYTEDGGLVGLLTTSSMGKEIGSVNAWYNEFGQESASLSHAPQFVSARDYHLQSKVGHWTAKGFVKDTVSSDLLDAGDPLSDVGEEQSPHGGRINLGRYGGTDEASKTPDEGALILISLNDGGKASGDAFPITWLARGSITNQTLKIEYWNGSAWQTLATNVAVSAGRWLWNTTSLSPSVQGKLRLTASDGTVVENTSRFSVRNKGNTFKFYINDSSRTGDQYCTQVGKNTADGLTPATPMLNLNTLLSTYDLDAGDTVYVDVGTYDSGSTPWQITQADTAGDEEFAPVVIQGPTNTLFGGAILNRKGNPRGIEISYGIGLEVRNLCVSNASETAFSVQDSYGVRLIGDVAENVGTGFSLSSGSRVSVEHSVVFDAKEGIAVSTAPANNTNAIDPRIMHCLFWNIKQADLVASGQRTVYANHNIFTIEPGGYIYSVDRRTHFVSDFNCFVLDEGDRVFRRVYESIISPVPDIYDTVGAWATESGNDTHSYEGDPRFVDVEGRDFHLKSTAGHYNLKTKKWVKDSEDSPLIDAGDAQEGVGQETSPNGGRRNIGLYGGTSQASKSGTTGHYVLLSYNRGGLAAGRVSLTWNALGASSNSTVRIEVSPDNGNNWTSIGQGIDASFGEVLWNSTPFACGPLYRWRIVDEGKKYPTVESQSPFIVHNSGIAFYVNDDTLEEGDYCSAFGQAENDGLSPATPMRWLSDVVTTYHLTAGDVVYVDGGRYQTEDTVLFDELDSGKLSRNEGGYVRIQGQTNELAAKTVFINPMNDRPMVAFRDAYGIRLRNIQMIGGSNSVEATSSYYIDLDGIQASGAQIGLLASSSSNLWVTHSAIVGMKEAAIDFEASGLMLHNIFVENSVLWSNRYGVHLHSGYAFVTNSIISALGRKDFAYYVHTDMPRHQIMSDYNAIYVKDGAAGGMQSGKGDSARTTLYSRVSAWVVGEEQDSHSLAQEPGFVDASASDFHLKSVMGYWTGSGWAYSRGSSPLIDAGNPRDVSWVNESTPNGRRVNIGMYGGTPQASKTPEGGWLTPLVLVDGGSAAGQVELFWQAGGAATNDSVCIEYSPDNGVTWQSIVSGWPATEDSYVWDSSQYGSSALGLWRLYSERDPSIVGMTMNPFVLRNGGSIAYYVNDKLDEGDIYCSAAGDDANDGLTPATPKASLQAILDSYELADADVVYVDAGRYTGGSPLVTIDGTDSGHDDLYVTIQGSTNPVARTVFHGANSDDCVFKLAYAENVKLKDLVIENAQEGVTMTMCINCQLEDVRIQLNRVQGLSLDRSVGTLLTRTLFWRNLSTTGGVAMVVGQSSDVTLLNCILWGSWTAIRSLQGTAVNVTNSVLQARNADGRIYDFSSQSIITNVVHADYNVYQRRDGAILAEQEYLAGGSDLYDDLIPWSVAIRGDRHSFAMEPAFVDPDGSGDFHLKSPMGYFSTNDWNPEGSHWRYAMDLSPLVDAGDPSFDVGAEEEPNGGICNIGIYGGTGYASLTPDYEPWVTALSFNEECVITTNALLYWNYGGMPKGTTVTLQYSLDYGVHWTDIVTGLPIGVREYEWDVAKLPLTISMRWRVVASTGQSDESDADVAVKTKSYDYYVNDGSREGDVYCHREGADWEEGADIGQNPDCPLRSLLDLFEHYPVGAGDRVFIDTGVYNLGTNVLVIGNANSGLASFPLEIVGSTNWQAGGSVITGDESSDCIVLQNVRYVNLTDLALHGMRNGIVMKNVSDVNMHGMDIRDNTASGVLGQNAADILIENSVLACNKANGVEFVSSQIGTRTVLQSTLVNNEGAGISSANAFVISNSIVVTTNGGAVGIRLVGATASAIGDYNLYWTGGSIVTNTFSKSAYRTVRSWQDEAGEDHSFSTDPLFVDLQGGDYHLQSRAGCWSNGVWVKAGQTSWAIDAGSTNSLAYELEPSPNGSRVNLGAYGGTLQASATDTSKNELFALTLNDGGVAPNGQVLRWLARGIPDNNKVKLFYSDDNGANWTQIIETSAGDGVKGYEWLSTGDPSPLSKWKVELVADPSVKGETESTFVYRPSPIKYYVNDSSRVGDVYTTAIGASGNNGYQPGSPMDSVQRVLETYQLTPDDSIMVDAGTYELDQQIMIASLHSGTSEGRVRIVGSTNPVMKTRFEPAIGMTNSAIGFNSVHDFELSNLQLVNFDVGVDIPQFCRQIYLSDLDFDGMRQVAISSSMASDIYLTHVLMRHGLGDGISFSTGQRLYLDGCVLWGNASNGVTISQASKVYISNSVISADGFGNYCYMVSTGEVVHADYNDLFLRNAAQIASVHGQQYERMPQWVTMMGEDRHSLSVDPLFADPENGDFHPRSVYGRFDPKAGASGKWVRDAHDAALPDVSPLIDLGGRDASWENEPEPNGGRRNIGIYGDTWQASKSQETPWVEAITAMSGGLAAGTFYLTWGYGGDIDSNSWVRLEYSPFHGEGDWYYIATNRIWQEAYYWVSDQKSLSGSEQWPTSPEGKWRLVLVGNTNVWDESAPFGLRNNPFRYYVNNDSTNGDVYTTAVGDDRQTGFWSNVPKLTLQSLLENVDLEPTDEVYVDTGEYYMRDTNNPILWLASDGGEAGSPVRLIGSTNAGRSLFVVSNVFAASDVFDLNAEHVEVRDIDFANRIGGNRSISVSMSGAGLDVGRMAIDKGTLNLVSAGGLYSNVTVNGGSVTLSGLSNRVTRMEVMGGTLDIVGTNAMLENSVIYWPGQNSTAVTVRALSSSISNSTVVAANGTAISKSGTGLLTLANNILVAGGKGTVIEWLNGTVKSDYNDLYTRGSAWIGLKDGNKWEKLAYWQKAAGVDAHSMSMEPKFANETNDFHLRSRAVDGRYDRQNARWRSDSEHSPLIDMANPLLTAGAEMLPNGARRNLGAYGGTEEASKSITNFWVQTISLNDGGVVKGTNVTLQWAQNRQAGLGGQTVRLEYSTDGKKWTKIAGGLTANNGVGEYQWDTTKFGDSFTAFWRVVSETYSSVSNVTDQAFNVRNHAQDFYVSAKTGANTNDGLSAGTARRDIQSLLDRYDLEGGDVVHVAAGTYENDTNIEVIWSRSGSEEDGDVLIKGEEGVEIKAGTPGITIHASDFEWSGAKMAVGTTNTTTGVLVDQGVNVTLSEFDFDRQTTAIQGDHARNLTVRNSSFWNTGVGVSLLASRYNTLENLTFVDTAAGIKLEGDSDENVLRNNIFKPKAYGAAYDIGTAVNLLSDAFMDYNIYDLGAEESSIFVGAPSDLRKWQLAMNNDYRSEMGDAGLINPERGDFHPKSPYGRWDGTTFVKKKGEELSFAVDHGDPTMGVGAEQKNHGGRINIGRYGGLAQASKGSTNIAFGIRTLDEPGLEIPFDDPNWPLVWDAHLVDSNAIVKIEFSGDYGKSWTELARTNAYAEYCVWTFRTNQMTDSGLWRVITTDGNWSAQSTNIFKFKKNVDLKFLSAPYPYHGLMRVKWQGGLAGYRYIIQYSDDCLKTPWKTWEPEYNGPEKINRSDFVLQPGETALEYIFEDVTSFGKPYRWYRIECIEPEGGE